MLIFLLPLTALTKHAVSALTSRVVDSPPFLPSLRFWSMNKRCVIVSDSLLESEGMGRLCAMSGCLSWVFCLRDQVLSTQRSICSHACVVLVQHLFYASRAYNTLFIHYFIPGPSAKGYLIPHRGIQTIVVSLHSQYTSNMLPKLNRSLGPLYMQHSAHHHHAQSPTARTSFHSCCDGTIHACRTIHFLEWGEEGGNIQKHHVEEDLKTWISYETYRYNRKWEN